MRKKIMRKWGYVCKDVNLLQLLTNSGLVLFFKVSGALAGYLFTYLVSNYYGARIYGIYELCYTGIMIAGVAGRLGLDGALVRFMAEFKSKKQFGTLRRVYRKSMVASGVLSVMLGAALYLLAPELAARLATGTESLEQAFRVTAFLIPPFVWLGMNTEALRGLRRMTDFSLLQYGSIVLLAALGILLIHDRVPDHLTPVYSYGGGVILLMLVSMILIRWRIRQAGEVPAAPGPGMPFRTVLNVALPILLSTSMFLVISWTDTLMIGYFIDETHVGIYRVAFRIATLITFLQFAINSIAAPMISEFFARNDVDSIRRITHQIGYLNLVLSTPIFLGIVLFPHFVLGLFGDEFTVAVVTLIILAAGQLINALCGPVLYILNMTGKEITAQRIMMATSVLNVALNLWLIPAYGFRGAAIATSVSMILWNILAVRYIRREYGFITFPLPDQWKKVNFFLIGAAKSGTTTLYERMKNHPEVYLSPLKEPNFWSTDIDVSQFSPAFRANTPLDLSEYFRKDPLPELPVAFLRKDEEYARLFDSVQNEQVVGECSTSYLYSKVAAERIAQAFGNVKILVVLRDPVERLFSHYLMARKYGYTTLPLQKAVEQDLGRIDKGWGCSELFVELGLYGAQLERWYKRFDRTRIKVLFTTQLDEPDTWNELYKWLGLGSHRAAGTEKKEGEKVNMARRARWEGINKWLTDKGLKKALGAMLPSAFRQKLLNFYYTDVHLPQLSAKDRKYLEAFYAKDKERLEAVLRRPVPWN